MKLVIEPKEAASLADAFRAQGAEIIRFQNESEFGGMKVSEDHTGLTIDLGDMTPAVDVLKTPAIYGAICMSLKKSPASTAGARGVVLAALQQASGKSEIVRSYARIDMKKGAVPVLVKVYRNLSTNEQAAYPILIASKSRMNLEDFLKIQKPLCLRDASVRYNDFRVFSAREMLTYEDGVQDLYKSAKVDNLRVYRLETLTSRVARTVNELFSTPVPSETEYRAINGKVEKLSAIYPPTEFMLKGSPKSFEETMQAYDAGELIFPNEPEYLRKPATRPGPWYYTCAPEDRLKVETVPADGRTTARVDTSRFRPVAEFAGMDEDDSEGGPEEVEQAPVEPPRDRVREVVRKTAETARSRGSVPYTNHVNSVKHEVSYHTPEEDDLPDDDSDADFSQLFDDDRFD